MKRQNLSKAPKPQLPDPNPDNDEHRIAASVRNRHPKPVRKKPLAGRIFYLDLPFNKRSQALESGIKSLGGTVEKFFSKDIQYLVSCKPDARPVQRLIHDSPVPSPDSSLSSPHPGSRRDSHVQRGSSQGPADTVVASRGKSLVEKVVKEQDRVQMNRIQDNALEWGVKILYVDDVIAYVDKKKRILASVRAETHSVKKTGRLEFAGGAAFQTDKPVRIGLPFIKVEDSSSRYKPLYLHMASLPLCNFRSAAPYSPFLEANVGESSGKRRKGCRSGGERQETSEKDKRQVRERKGRRKGGNCECCSVKYNDISAHLRSEQHQAFSKSDQYLVVDRIISGFACDFVQINSEITRMKCSVTSPLIVPGAAVTNDEKMGVKEEPVTDKTALLGSDDNERSVCKRYRELSRSPKADYAGQSDTFLKFRSKRGSFEWESSSYPPLQKVLGHSECLDTNRSSLHAPLEGRTSQRTRRVRLSDPARFRTSRSSLDAGTSYMVPEPSVSSTFQNPPKLHLDVAECTTETLLCNSGRALNVTYHKPINEDVSSSSSTDNPSEVLQRKVRTMRRRRTAPSEPMFGPAGNPVESQTPPCLENVSAQDLLQLFLSGGDMDEDFQGFHN